jgi:hypothetical protein
MLACFCARGSQVVPHGSECGTASECLGWA